MVADIAGFSRLMELAESQTFTRARQVRDDITTPKVEEYGGRIIKTTGDGFLAEFASSAAALRCGIDIQRSLIALEADQPGETRIHLRIGINIGDIIIDGNDIAGDGVNVAARLEAMAPLDGLCISSMVHDQIRDDLGVAFKDIGEQQLKNIARPVRAFTVSIGDGTVSRQQPNAMPGPTGRSARFKALPTAIVGFSCVALIVAAIGWYWQSARTTPASPSPAVSDQPVAGRALLSIMVLPFANGTGDPQKGYIADGLTASLTSDLSRIRDVFVVAAVTAFTYKDKSVNLQQLHHDLGVRFVLQGRVQSSGDKIRIDAQLVDARSNAQLWVEVFEGNGSNLFALEDQVTSRIGNSIGREMIVAMARESETRQSDLAVTDLILHARAAELQPQSLKNWEEIEGWYRKALDLDAKNTSAMAGLARALVIPAFNFGHLLPADVKEKKFVDGRDLALKVRELDPKNLMVYNVLALYAVTHDDFPALQRASETWLALDPKNPMPYNYVAATLIFRGKPQEAIDLLVQGADLDPKNPSALIAISMFRAYFMLGDNDKTIEWANRTLELNSRFSESYAYLAMAYALKGDEAKAREAVAALRRADPKFKLGELRKPGSSSPAAYKAFFDGKYLPTARKAGLPE